ncbi:tRNA (adenosine(37)-N6)-threonylcarbamoyltransferase complex dimerization subunit type 1 TsaB [Aquifex pyrophilus]
MRILSIDTSYSFLNLSIIEEGKVKFLHYIDSDKKTLENMPKVLNDLCIRPEDFDAFAVSVGVGYLTSLRIGVTFVKTWAYTLKKPIVSFRNLELLSAFTHVEYPKIPYLKVSNNVFYQIVEENKKSEIKIYKGESLKGTGISLEIFKEVKLGDKQFFYPFFPFSAYGGIYAYRFLEKNPEGENVFSIEPIYVKPPVG